MSVPPQPLQRREGMEAKAITHGQWLHQEPMERILLIPCLVLLHTFLLLMPVTLVMQRAKGVVWESISGW